MVGHFLPSAANKIVMHSISEILLSRMSYRSALLCIVGLVRVHRSVISFLASTVYYVVPAALQCMSLVIFDGIN